MKLRRRTAATTLLGLAASAVTVLAAPAAVATAPGQPRADLERQQVELINDERTSQGLPELQTQQMLTRLARSHAQRMAMDSSSAGARSLCGDGVTLRHRSPLDTGFTQNWTTIRENVGCDGFTERADHVHKLFMGSQYHRENIVADDVSLVGVGTYLDSAQVLWTTQIFMKEADWAKGNRPPTVLPVTDVLEEGVTAASAVYAADSAEHVVLGRSDNFPDSLGGAALAAGEGPVLFTDAPNATEKDTVLNPAARDELDRVLPDGGKVFLLGGHAAVSPQTERELRANGYQVERLAGEDRTTTAVRIAEQVVATNGTPDRILIANGWNWPDAITGGTAAGVHGVPLVLVRQGRIDEVTQSFLDRYPDAERLVLGGPSAVSPDLVAQLGARVLAGASRVSTAVAVADEFFTETNGDLVVGRAFGDTQWGLTLAWSSASMTQGTPQLIARTDIAGRDPELATWLRAHAGDIGEVTFTSAVEPALRAEVLALLGR